MANRKRKGERSDGLIQVTLDIGYDANGKRIRKSFYGKSRTEAERKREEYKKGYANNITVGEWVTICKDTYRPNVDEAYLVNDNAPYNRLVNELGYMSMRDVTEADLQHALNKVSGMSFSTVNKYKYCLLKVFGKARKNKIIPDNPAEDLIMPPYSKGTHRALESWEIEHILRHWNEPGLRAGLWVMIMMLAGLRRGEMIALDWSAVDLTNRMLNINQTAVIKGNQSTIVRRAKTDAGIRSIPICQQLYDALSSVPVKARSGLVCLSVRGKQLSESAVSRGLETFCNGLERIANGEPALQHGRRNDLIVRPTNENRIRFSFRAHDLRHTFATLLYDSNVDVKSAQYLLGHSDIKMTLDLYTHLSQERENESRLLLMKGLDGLLDERAKNTLNGNGNGGKMVVYDMANEAENR